MSNESTVRIKEKQSRAFVMAINKQTQKVRVQEIQGKYRYNNIYNIVWIWHIRVFGIPNIRSTEKLHICDMISKNNALTCNIK